MRQRQTNLILICPLPLHLLHPLVGVIRPDVAVCSDVAVCPDIAADDATSDADEEPGVIEEDMEVYRLRENKMKFNNRD